MSSSSTVHLWLRAETKKNERRTALTPTVGKKLLDLGRLFLLTNKVLPQLQTYPLRQASKSRWRSALSAYSKTKTMSSMCIIPFLTTNRNTYPTIWPVQSVGCELVETGTWRTAPSDAYIFGLKELPENDTTPLPHAHIMFAHCYKQQAGWKDVLGRFDRGNGLLLDLEFLQDDKGKFARAVLQMRQVG